MRCYTMAFAMAVILGTMAGGRAAAPPLQWVRGDARERTLQKALANCLRTLGDDHPKTGSCYSNLGACRSEQGKHTEALLLYCKALKIHSKALGEMHPTTAASTGHVASSLNAQGRYA